jgi:hypothetical protein
VATPPIESIGALLHFLQTSHLCEQCRKEESPPTEQRFEELFKAARTLFKEGVGQEDLIIPTLAFANDASQDIPAFWAAPEEDHEVPLPGPVAAPRETQEAQETQEDMSVLEKKRLMALLERLAERCRSEKAQLVREKQLLVDAEGDAEAWESRVAGFIREFDNMRPVRIVDGILFLERLPISIGINRFSPESDVKVSIKVYGHPRPAKPEEARALYEKELSNAGISESQTQMQHADMRFVFLNPSSLIINIGPKLNLVDEQAAAQSRASYYPHPWLVQEFYRALLGRPSKEGFARYLTGRQRGGAPEAHTLIPACVAYYLRAYLAAYGEKHDRKKIHRLLNRHVLCETWKTLPEGEYDSVEVNQLWRDVGKVAAPLVRTSSRLLATWPRRR